MKCLDLFHSMAGTGAWDCQEHVFGRDYPREAGREGRVGSDGEDRVSVCALWECSLRESAVE